MAQNKTKYNQRNPTYTTKILKHTQIAFWWFIVTCSDSSSIKSCLSISIIDSWMRPVAGEPKRPCQVHCCAGSSWLWQSIMPYFAYPLHHVQLPCGQILLLVTGIIDVPQCWLGECAMVWLEHCPPLGSFVRLPSFLSAFLKLFVDLWDQGRSTTWMRSPRHRPGFTW